jgi:hypothetical protein
MAVCQSRGEAENPVFSGCARPVFRNNQNQFQGEGGSKTKNVKRKEKIVDGDEENEI